MDVGERRTVAESCRRIEEREVESMKKKEMKKLYPTLAEMGVETPEQIEHYYVTSINYVEVLRIIYDRPKTSFLTSSRVYKFPRVQDKAPAEGGDGNAQPILKMHPMLKAAKTELDKILATRAEKVSIASEILHEIELLEEDIALRGEYLKELVKKIPSVC